ncbi:nitroreductase family protein [Candidatus Bathyarchaeota archaeon]|nr:nitroreductase family protein [Candidatus Bathyarchaeota archaeon]
MSQPPPDAYTSGRRLNVLSAIRKRRSIRSFLERDVAESDVRRILECGTLAPSAGNLQPWQFVVVRDQQRKAALARAAYDQMFIAEAPVVIVVLADQSRSASVYGRRGLELYAIQDTAAAIQNMLLAACEMGYGTCWVGAFDEDSVAEIVKAGRGTKPVAVIPVGYPRYTPAATRRRRLSEVIHEETYQS